MTPDFFEDGYAVYDKDPQILKWVSAAQPLAQAALNDDAQLEKWLVCQGSWFVGVDALATGPEGQANEAALDGQVIRDLKRQYQVAHPLHKAQLSVVFPGYPKPREGESDAAFRFREKRDAAHVDGLHATGPKRRRHVFEHHAYILGLPINDVSSNASPLVVWRHSHKIVRSWLRKTLLSVGKDTWQTVDLTEEYLAIRRQIFETCERVELAALPGQAVVLHRHTLHGVAPWAETARADSDCRMIAYFRPEIVSSKSDWLELP